MKRPTFDLVIPAYNEKASLNSLITRTVQAAEIHGFTPDLFQLVVVENGSDDGSWELLEDLQKTQLGQWFRVVRVLQNRGYGYGLMQGLRSSSAEVLGWTHADEQCDPLDAFRAVEVLQGHAAAGNQSFIKGKRRARPYAAWACTQVFEFLGRLIVGVPVREINAQPKVFSRSLLNLVTTPPDHFALDFYFCYAAQKNGFHIESIPVEFKDRRFGTSKWSATPFLRYKTMLKMITYMCSLLCSEGRAKRAKL